MRRRSRSLRSLRLLRSVAAWSAVLALATALLSPVGAAVAQEAVEAAGTFPAGFSDTLVASGMGTATAVERLPDGRFLVASQGGTLWAVASDGSSKTAVRTFGASELCTQDEEGLLGVAVDPASGPNYRVYLYMTARVQDSCATSGLAPAGAKNRIAAFRLSGNTLTADGTIIDNMPTYAGNHNGGEVKVAGGTLWVGVGDGGGDPQTRPQDLSLPNGKVLRVNLNGSVPSDNPYAGTGVACTVAGFGHGQVCREIWADGLRNPFRFGWDLDTAATPGIPRFMINDVGQSAWEEADLNPASGGAGAHYGWPCFEANVSYQGRTGCNTPITAPALAYNHGNETGTNGCNSVTAGAFVPNGAFGAYSGHYLWVDFICGRMFAAAPAEFNAGATDVSPVELATGMNGTSDMEFFDIGCEKALYYTTLGGALRRVSYGTPSTPTVAGLRYQAAVGSQKRVLDTRTTGRPGDGSVTTFTADDAAMPIGVKAVALNLTATDTTGPGFVTAFPGSGCLGPTSSLNISGAGETAANAVVVRVDELARVNLYTQRATNLIADITGYFTEANGATDGRFAAPAAPVRVLDTRSGVGKPAVFQAGEQFDLTVATGAPVPPGATGVVLTLTYVDPSAPGYITAWPTGSPAGQSTLNPNGPGDIRSNLALVGVGAGGKVSLFSLVRTHLIVDVVGWFAPGNGSTGLFTSVVPERAADSRIPKGFGRVPAGSSVQLTFGAATSTPPSPSSAVLANFTATNTGSGGYLSVYPADTPPSPPTSTVNWSAAGQTRATLGVSGLSGTNRLRIGAPYDVDAIVDVAGWFAT